MKIKYFLLIITLLWVAESFAQVAIRTDIGVVGYKTTCFDPLQVSSTPGFGLQLGADYVNKKSFSL